MVACLIVGGVLGQWHGLIIALRVCLIAFDVFTHAILIAVAFLWDGGLFDCWGRTWPVEWLYIFLRFCLIVFDVFTHGCLIEVAFLLDGGLFDCRGCAWPVASWDDCSQGLPHRL